MGNVVARPQMSWSDKLLVQFLLLVDRIWPWYRMPVILGVLYLDARKHLMQRNNLKPVGKDQKFSFDPKAFTYRSLDGTHNDPDDAQAGAYGSFFGRNMVPQNEINAKGATSPPDIQDPNPFLVAQTLLARPPRTTVPSKLSPYTNTGTQFNVLAASWIQFMIHDWFDHLEGGPGSTALEAPPGLNGCPLRRMTFHPTVKESTGMTNPREGHINIRTPWWDGSAVYGQTPEKATSLRTGKGGKLIDGGDTLAHGPDGVARVGDVRNSWIGVSLLQDLFVKEHNDVAQMLSEWYPTWDDDQLYNKARLVVAAEIGKIHTIDWTCELLKMPTLNVAMKANWYGLFGKWVKEHLGHTGISELSGLVGLPKPDNHGVPYSLTEEFCSVYRMHSLLPDEIEVLDVRASILVDGKPPPKKLVPMEDLHGIQGERTLLEEGPLVMLTSLGFQSCGLLCLNNYPNFMRDIAPENVDGTPRGDHVDMAALEIWRDRERNVPRYNNFRRQLHAAPIKTWADLTGPDDTETQSKLRSVYGDDVEKLDLLVGMQAERFIPGFAISETAFYIFIIMASRRLEADRFFTSDFRPEVYTPEGFERVRSTEGIADLLKRHYPDLYSAFLASKGISGFNTWDAVPPKTSWLPQLIQFPSSDGGPITT
ncbi:alpha-dioxygenase [Klebsormidium nitens]|uniref:Alpha-dioxygenase n=1 Tax=Klebsormidium nitens TaxID=105231 RepID=A0A1Y1IDI0_KLENI|nr:alpha-dioxygenase [Klebsormidium nitens]|eukprot:GAQ86148.1 alpha-dioxygenase [Klebsormidium nitens]